MSNNEIKLGSKVRIAKTSEYYGRSPDSSNPRDVIGEVIETKYSRSYPIRVHWSNGWKNVYELTDLELVEQSKPKRSEWLPKAIAYAAEGKKSKEISKLLGVPARTIRHNLQKEDGRLTRNITPKGLSQETLDRLKAQSDAATQAYIRGANAERLQTAPELPDYLVQGKKPTIFVIPDTQCKQGVDLDYIHWVGAYIARKKPDIIVHLGDHYDMASLSTYDKGKLSAENKRYAADIEAGDEGIRILESYIQAVPNYNPRKVVTLGNHEDRIDRFVQDNPSFEGLLGTDKLAFDDYGWEVYPFLTPVNICGINFVHYLQNTMTGKPLGGTALNRLKSVGESFVMGHVQTYDFCQRPLPLTGKHQIGLIVGACYEHDEGYKGVQGNHHFRGCVMLYECADGYAMHKAVTLRHMKELYERGTA